MNISRKNFLIGSMSVAALGARQMFAVPAGSVTGKVNLKFGVLSDIHLEFPHERDHFVKTLEWYRDQNIDALMIAGDLVNHGIMSQMKLAADAWFKVFPDNKMPDGRPVVQLFEYGNHCVHPETDWHRQKFPDAKERAKNLIATDPAKAWQDLFHEAYSPIFTKFVKGYQFTGAHWTAIKMRKEWFEANLKKVDPSKPFFYFQHQHPRGTCHYETSRAWGSDDGTATRALSTMPNAVAFSGHSHAPLTDEDAIWQGEFTSIGTGSLSYSWGGDGMVPNLTGSGEGRHGMLISVCDDHMRIERRDFWAGQTLGEDWIVPTGKGAAHPYETAKRKALRVAPEFPPNSFVTVEQYHRPPKEDGIIPPPFAVKLTFPHAEDRKKCRVFKYYVEVVGVVDGKEKVFDKAHALAPDYCRPPSKANLGGICLLDFKRLPKDVPVHFVVSPEECFGTRGAPIRSKVPFVRPTYS